MDVVVRPKHHSLEKWMPGRNRVNKITLWTPPPFLPKFYSEQRVIAAFYNSGKHVYWSTSWPTKGQTKTFKILWFAKFGSWSCLHTNVWVRHIGHSWFKNSKGDANTTILVRCNGIFWNLKIQPHQKIYVVEYYPFQSVYRSFKRTGAIDQKSLSHG